MMSFTMPEWPRRAAVAFFVPLLSLFACASPAIDPASAEALGRTSAAVVGGQPSGPADDAVVLIVFTAPGKDEIELCTGTLIAPKLVLTARHCVAETELAVACTSEGKPTSGGAISGERDPRHLYVFTGSERPVLRAESLKNAAHVAEILDDGATNLCDHDLALLLLDAPIEGITPATIRLDGDVTKGEGLSVVGWGVTETASEPAERQQRAGVKVVRVGPDTTSPPIGRNEILFDESICLGDSGGPVFAESTGAVVAVVSRGGNGSSAGDDPASTCVGATNLGIKLSSFRSLLATGFERAGASPREEVRAAKDEGCSASRARPDGSAVALGGIALMFGVARCRRSRASRGRHPASNSKSERSERGRI